MTKFQRAFAETERRLNTPDYYRLYKAGARLARTGGGKVRPASYSRANGLGRWQALAVRDGYTDEMAKPRAKRHGLLGSF